MSTAFRMAMDPVYAKLRKQTYHHVENSSKDQAIKSASLFHARYPNDPDSNYNLARALVRQGKSQVALDHAELANKLSPNNARYIFLLGRLYLDFALYEYAAPLLRDAVDKLPNDVLMQWAMADFHFALGNGKEAEKYYKLALSLGPELEKRASLLQDYAKCMAASNANERALELYSELENLPGHAISSLIRKSQIERHLADSDIAQQLHKMLNDQCLEKEQRSDILLSLGNMYDNAGRHDEAFEYWSKSRALKTITAKETIGIETVEKIKKFYSASLLQQAAKYGHTSERPVFVVGMPRSGTTLTEQIISSHPEAYGVGELGRMQKLVPSFTKDYTVTNYIEKLIQNAKAGELKARANETLNLLEILAGTSPRFVVDKLPTQYLAMGYIHLCFPNAKYIHCQRHPADSFISSFQNNMKQFHEYSFDQLLYAETYLAKQNLMAHWKSIFPERIFDLKYEKLVTKPEETVREMLDFIGLPWDSACMSFFERDRTVKTFSRDQVRNPIYTSSVYRWKKYEKNLEPLFADLKAADFEYSDV